jgi:hypothetical protein
MELALEWEESQRKAMYDPTKADYFLQYTDGKGNKNGTICASAAHHSLTQLSWHSAEHACDRRSTICLHRHSHCG